MEGNEFKDMLAEIRKLEGEKSILLTAIKASMAEHMEVKGFLIDRIANGESVYNWLNQTDAIIDTIQSSIAKSEGRPE